MTFCCCLVCLLALVGISGCGPMVKKSADDGESYSVIDDYGNVLEFSHSPVRIYANTLSLEEVLVHMVSPERIAAISIEAGDADDSLIAEEAAAIPRKLPRMATVEQIVALHPDLVLAQGETHVETVQTLQDMGIPVLVMKVPINLTMVRERILRIAQATGELECGQEMVARLDAQLRDVAARVALISEEDRKTVMAFSGAGAFGSVDGIFNDICIHSGVINGAGLSGIAHNGHLHDEQILDIDPDIFLFPEGGPENVYGKKVAERVRADPALQTVKAIREQHYIFIKDRYRAANSQFMGDAVEILARLVYPEIF